MSDNSSIEWTETTWNPTTGCDRISDGCDNCYALALAKRAVYQSLDRSLRRRALAAASRPAVPLTCVSYAARAR